MAKSGRGIRAGLAFVSASLDDKQLQLGLARAERRLKSFGKFSSRVSVAAASAGGGGVLGVSRVRTSSVQFVKTAQRSLRNARSAFMKFGTFVATTMSKAFGLASQSLERFGRGIQSMSVKLQLLGGGLALGLLSTLRPAARVQDSFTRLRILFGENAAEAEKFVQGLADQIRRTPTFIRESLNSFQAFAKGLGIANDQAIEFSKTMTQLQFDFAAVTGNTAGESLRRFIAALAGSPEVLDQYGINLKEAALQQELMSLGMTDGVKNATEMQKTVARMSAVFKSLNSQNSIGQASKLINNLSVQLDFLSGAFLEMRAAIGDALIPALSPFTDFISVLVPKLMAWVRANQTVVQSALRMSIVVAGVGTVMLAFSAIVKLAAFALGGVSTALKLLTVVAVVHKAVMLGIGAVYAVVSGAISLLVSGFVVLMGAMLAVPGVIGAVISAIAGMVSVMSSVAAGVVGLTGLLISFGLGVVLMVAKISAAIVLLPITIYGAITGIVAALSTFFTALSTFTALLGFFAASAAPVVGALFLALFVAAAGAIAVVVAGIKTVIGLLNKIGSVAKSGFSSLVGGAKQAGIAVASVGVNAAMAMKDLASGAIGEVMRLAPLAIRGLMQIGSATKNLFGELFSGFAGIARGLMPLYASIKEGLKDAIAAGDLRLAFSVAMSGVRIVWNQTLAVLTSSLANWFATVAPILITGFTELVSAISNSILKIIEVFDPIIAIVQRISQAVSGLFGKLSGSFDGASFEPVVGSLEEMFDDLIIGIKAKFLRMIDEIKFRIQNLRTKFSSDEVKDGVAALQDFTRSQTDKKIEKEKKAAAVERQRNAKAREASRQALAATMNSAAKTAESAAKSVADTVSGKIEDAQKDAEKGVSDAQADLEKAKADAKKKAEESPDGGDLIGSVEARFRKLLESLSVGLFDATGGGKGNASVGGFNAATVALQLSSGLSIQERTAMATEKSATALKNIEKKVDVPKFGA